jgi:hypothetical protein
MIINQMIPSTIATANQNLTMLIPAQIVDNLNSNVNENENVNEENQSNNTNAPIQNKNKIQTRSRSKGNIAISDGDNNNNTNELERSINRCKRATNKRKRQSNDEAIEEPETSPQLSSLAKLNKPNYQLDLDSIDSNLKIPCLNEEQSGEFKFMCAFQKTNKKYFSKYTVINCHNKVVAIKTLNGLVNDEYLSEDRLNLISDALKSFSSSLSSSATSSSSSATLPILNQINNKRNKKINQN